MTLLSAIGVFLALSNTQLNALAAQMNDFQYTNALDGAVLSHHGEFFDVYSHPFKLNYAEALHSFQEALPLPKDVIQRFEGRTMAVTGYETDWEIFDAGKWRRAKCTEAYTHHYQLYMFSSKASPEVVNRNLHPNDDIPPPLYPPEQSIQKALPVQAPLVQTFMEGNGNENRGSFHGLPEGFAQLIDSPAFLRNLYHVINTRTPSGTARWGPGSDAPLPQASVAPLDAPYSGLIECPCSSRRGDYRRTGIIAQNFPSNKSGKPFKALCVPGGMLETQQNSICRVESYQGGLQCCDEGMIMLDIGQNLPMPPSKFRYRMRWYFLDYESLRKRPQEAFFLFAETEDWQSEFDISHKRAPSIQVLTRNFRARDLFGGLLGWNSPHRFNCSRLTTAMCGGVHEVEAAGGYFELRYAHFHQHVGMLGGILLNTDTGEVLCETQGVYGTGDTSMNELGYVVAIPPCVWHDEAPQLHLDSNLSSIAKYNASTPHLAVMSMWEMRGAFIASGGGFVV
eukprot:TRINITY_DN94830_c0_g1_i1.p1 TRINITY_DN94830_c0_g1~~TRINITY_DN94830_c0_g1_i1.p1  ORF type:complete len:509 (+),score=48.69 TRINITY_DN94830_c0_g1_i1:28-1554(+)